MTSQDNQQYLTVEMFNAKMDAFMATIRLENEKLRNELHSEIKAVETEVKINSAKIADLQNSFAIYFGIATLIITFLAIVKGVLTAFAPRIWAFFDRRKQDPAVTQEQVQNMIDKAIAKAFSSIGK